MIFLSTTFARRRSTQTLGLANEFTRRKFLGRRKIAIMAILARGIKMGKAIAKILILGFQALNYGRLFFYLLQ